MAARVLATELARHVREHDDRELEALGLVHGHQADAVTPLLHHRRLGRFAPLGGLAQRVHEAAERDAAVRLVLPRELDDLQHVREHALAGRTHDERHVRARVLEQPAERLGRRTMIPPRVQRPQERERLADRLQALGQILGDVERMEPVARMRVPVLEQRLLPDREQRAPQRRIHVQRIVGPLDGRERRAQRLDLLAIVERPAADEQVRDVARLERVHVRPRDVVGELDEAAEEDADVPRLDRHELRRAVPALGDLPVALVEQPVDPGADGVRKRLSMARIAMFRIPYGIRDGQDDDGRLEDRPADGSGCGLRASGSQAHVWLQAHGHLGLGQRACQPGAVAAGSP